MPGWFSGAAFLSPADPRGLPAHPQGDRLMDATQRFERIRKLIAEHLDVEPVKVTREAHFTDDLGADSLDYIELLMAAEEEFDIEITDDDAEGVQTVGQAADLIERRVAV